MQPVRQSSTPVSPTAGGRMPTQLRPPSVVRTREVHGACAHGAVPRPQPSSALTNVRSLIFRPLGTGPPTAPTVGAVGVALPWDGPGDGESDGDGDGAGAVVECVGAAGGVGEETWRTMATAANAAPTTSTTAHAAITGSSQPGRRARRESMLVAR